MTTCHSSRTPTISFTILIFVSLLQFAWGASAQSSTLADYPELEATLAGVGPTAETDDEKVIIAAYVEIFRASKPVAKEQATVAKLIAGALEEKVNQVGARMHRQSFERFHGRFMPTYWRSILEYANTAAIRAHYLAAKVNGNTATPDDLVAYQAIHPDNPLIGQRLIYASETKVNHVVAYMGICNTRIAMDIAFSFLKRNRESIPESHELQKKLLAFVASDKATEGDVDSLFRLAYELDMEELIDAVDWPKQVIRFPKNTSIVEYFGPYSDWHKMEPILAKRRDVAVLQSAAACLAGSNKVSDLSVSSEIKDLLTGHIAKTASARQVRGLMISANRNGVSWIADACIERGRSDTSSTFRDLEKDNRFQAAKFGLAGHATKQRFAIIKAACLVDEQADSEASQRPKSKSVASEKIRQVNGMPMPKKQPRGKEDVALWRRLARISEVVAEHPSYGEAHLARAKTLVAAGFFQDAVIAASDGLHHERLAELYALRATCWKVLECPEQALIDGQREKEATYTPFYGLPPRLGSHVAALAKAIEANDLEQAWNQVEKWQRNAPNDIASRLYGATAFAHLGAPYLTLSLLRGWSDLRVDDEHRLLIQRMAAVSHAQLGEFIPASQAQAQADGAAINQYWLLAFIEANEATAFARLDASLTKGATSNTAWLKAARLADAEKRDGDASFAAACWLVGTPLAEQATADQKIARSILERYRNGATAKSEEAKAAIAGGQRLASRAAFAEAMRRDPADLGIVAAAYVAARDQHEVFEAIRLLRHLWRNFGDAHLDLADACNLAVAAADWELLASMSQTALMRNPNEVFRGWNHLALIAGGYPKTAKIGERLLLDDARLAVHDGIRAWNDLVEPRWVGYVRKVSGGGGSDLHNALVKVESRVFYQKLLDEKHSDYHAQIVNDATSLIDKAKHSLPEHERIHLQFMLGDLSAESYTNQSRGHAGWSLGTVLRILRPWKISGLATLTELQTGELNAVLYATAEPLQYRVMAFRMLQQAKVVPALQPLRSSDALIIEGAPMSAISEMRLGRSGVLCDTNTLVDFLNGVRNLSASSNGRAPYRFPKTPPTMRLRLNPELPLQTVADLDGTNFNSKMQALARDSYAPFVERALVDHHAAIRVAKGNAEARWQAYKRLGAQVDDIGAPFRLEKDPYSDLIFASIKDNLNRYPIDAYVALVSEGVVHYRTIKQLDKATQRMAKIGASAQINAYREDQKNGGTSGSLNAAVLKVYQDYRPGSSWHSFVSAQLEKGTAPSQLEAAIDREKARREAKVVAQQSGSTVSATKVAAEFEVCMSKGNLSRAADIAYTLQGEYFVRWALRDPSVRMDELVRALEYAKPYDAGKLHAIINRRNRSAGHSGSGHSSSGSSFSSDSWGKFKADMESRRKAGLAHQRDRDIKNNIYKSKSYYK